MKTIGNLIIFIFTFLALIAGAYASDDNPLFAAVTKGDQATVEALLAKGADVNAKDEYGDTPLHKAETFQYKGIAELLLSKGADVNAGTKYGWTPLHTAVASGHKGFAELLLARGADANARNEDGYTPLHRAAEKNRNKDIAELLIARGADVNARNKSGNTPLHMAAYEGNTEVADLLVSKGADVNARNKSGNTPLHLAASWKKKEVAGLLLAKGADVNAKDNEGLTPLDNAWAIGSTPDIYELLENHVVKQAKRPQELFEQLLYKFNNQSSGKETRRLLLKLAIKLKPAPAIPEEARKHFVEGTAIVKAAKSPAQQALAVQSFIEALKIAPWWGDAYYNLGVAQELAENYDEAEQAFNFYLSSNPSEAEKREVQDRIYALSAKRKLSGAQ